MANCFATQMRAQQQVASLLNSSCHTGWSGDLAMYKGVSAVRTDREAGSQASTSPDNSSSDSEDHSPTTTLIIRNIPFSYTADYLKEELDRAGFWGKFDFLYLPSPGRCFGFKSAMVNFASPSVAQKFRALFHHRRFEYCGPQDAPLSVVVPPLQGFASCASKHPEGVVYKDSAMRFVDSKPTVFMPPPGLESVPFQPPIHATREHVLGQPYGRGRIPSSSPPGSWHVPPPAAAAIWSTGPARAKEQWAEKWYQRVDTSPANALLPRIVGNARAAAESGEVEAFYISL